MAKATGLDLNNYAPVAQRIALFFEAYPTGRIVTRLISRTEQDVVFKALVYRRAEDTRPAATGWAAEREGDGDVNLVACLENTETSAVGRALANLGFTASRERPSAEEMLKAARARARYESSSPRRSVVHEDGLQRRANIVTDLLRALVAAERRGLRPERAKRWRALVLTERFPEADLLLWDARLRAWNSGKRA